MYTRRPLQETHILLLLLFCHCDQSLPDGDVRKWAGPGYVSIPSGSGPPGLLALAADPKGVLVRLQGVSPHYSVTPPRPYLMPRDRAVVTRRLHIETFEHSSHWLTEDVKPGSILLTVCFYSEICDISQHNYTKVSLIITQHAWLRLLTSVVVFCM